MGFENDKTSINSFHYKQLRLDKLKLYLKCANSTIPKLVGENAWIVKTIQHYVNHFFTMN